MKIYLSACRVNAGMTQAEWAEKLNVTKQTVANWEKGITRPKMDQVIIMSQLSGIPIEHIFLPKVSTILTEKG